MMWSANCIKYRCNLTVAITFNISTHQHFSSFHRYFHDGLKTIEHFGTYIEDLVNKLTVIRQNQFEEKRDLEDVRNMLKTSPGFNKMVILYFKTFKILLDTKTLRVSHRFQCLLKVIKLLLLFRSLTKKPNGLSIM